MIVLTPLNFEFIIKIQNLTSFMLKNPQIFLPTKRLFLKDLYTSETTLAQKIVLTLLNNKFVLKIRYSTPIMQKSANIFGQNLKSDLKSGPSVMVYKYKNILNLKINIFVYKYQID